MTTKTRIVSFLVFSSFLFFGVACTPTVKYKSVTLETNPDGSQKKVETESISQHSSTTDELILEKVKMQGTQSEVN